MNYPAEDFDGYTDEAYELEANTESLKPLSFDMRPEDRAAIEALVERNENDPNFARRRRLDEEEKEREEFDHLQSMAGKALAGAYGNAAKAVAVDMIHDDYGRQRADRKTLEALRTALRKVPGRISA